MQNLYKASLYKLVEICCLLSEVQNGVSADKYSVSLCTRSISVHCLCLSTVSSSESVGTGVETTTERVHSVLQLHATSILTHRLQLDKD